jgi:hypothetical protein
VATHGNQEGSVFVRSAVAVGRSLGQWRRRRVAAAQDAYVTSWKAAWTEGCSAGWAGQPIASLPYREGPLRDAWAAGWNWSQTQPDRRSPSQTENGGAMTRRAHAERRRHLVSAAKGGALSLTLLAAARWLLRGRGQGSPPAPSPHSR